MERGRDDTIRVGSQQLKLGERLKEMEDSTSLLHDVSALRKKLATDGYVLLRNVLEKDKVLKARKVVTDTLSKQWGSIDTSKEPIDAYIVEGKKGTLLTGFRAVTHHKDVLDVLEGETLSFLMARLFGEYPSTFDNKWVRVHGQGECTDEHTDYYRFQGNARGMFTCWIPLGTYAMKQGCLAVCPGSHCLSGYNQNTYGVETKVELPPDYQNKAGESVWASTRFGIGDICIFDIRLVHASTENTTNRFRISMDTRWQPSSLVESSGKSCFAVPVLDYSSVLPSLSSTSSKAASAATLATGVASSAAAAAAAAAASSSSPASPLVQAASAPASVPAPAPGSASSSKNKRKAKKKKTKAKAGGLPVSSTAAAVADTQSQGGP